MSQISLFKVGLVAMLLFIIASNVLNYVSIASTTWAEDGSSSLWTSCYNQLIYREKCFKENPPALLATGTALNCLSLVLILVSQIALFVPKFKNSFALYFVIGAEVTTLLSLVFNSIGWYFVFFPQYQDIKLVSQNNAQPNYGPAVLAAFRLGWGFWLMTPSFGMSVLAAIVGSSILGCTCVTNNVQPSSKTSDLKSNNNIYLKNIIQEGGVYVPQDFHDPQVLRL